MAIDSITIAALVSVGSIAVAFAVLIIGSLIVLIGTSSRMQPATPAQRPIQYAVYTNCRGHSVYNSCTFLIHDTDPNPSQQQYANGQQPGARDGDESDPFPEQETGLGETVTPVYYSCTRTFLIHDADPNPSQQQDTNGQQPRARDGDEADPFPEQETGLGETAELVY